MNERVKNIIEEKEAQKEKAERIKRAKYLMSLGLWEVEYSKTQSYSDAFPNYDSKKEKYYRKVPIKVTDEEFEELLKYKEDDGTTEETSSNGVEIIFKVMAGITFIAGFIAGIATEEILMFWVAGFISGMLMFGFGEVIGLLQDIKNK